LYSFPSGIRSQVHSLGTAAIQQHCDGVEVTPLDRFAFYDRAKTVLILLLAVHKAGPGVCCLRNFLEKNAVSVFVFFGFFTTVAFSLCNSPNTSLHSQPLHSNAPHLTACKCTPARRRRGLILVQSRCVLVFSHELLHNRTSTSRFNIVCMLWAGVCNRAGERREAAIRQFHPEEGGGWARWQRSQT
jgi:hypothetical protein